MKSSEIINPFELDFQGMNLEAVQGETKAKITKLTNSELIISQDEEKNIEQSTGGVTFIVTTKIVGQSVWKRK